MKITGGRIKKIIMEEKESMTAKRNPNYLRTVNLIAPVVPKTGRAFNFNPQCPTAGMACFNFKFSYKHFSSFMFEF